MKKFLKNAVLIMLVTYFILNIVNFVWQYIEYNKLVLETAYLVGQINNGEITIEDPYAIFMGFPLMMEAQTIRLAGIIGISIIVGIAIGMIVTFEEKSKVRVLLIYIIGLLLVALWPTICDAIYYMEFTNFLEDMIYNLDGIWKWYTLIFFVIYAIKLYISNKKTKELNKILNEKQKQVNL